MAQTEIAGIVIAGGRAVRMSGMEKPLAPLGRSVLLDAVIARAAPQVGRLALNVRHEAAPLYRAYEEKGLPLLFDPHDGEAGPIGGIVAGLDWLAALDGPRWLMTFPADAPFLPPDLVTRLARHIAPGISGRDRPIAASDGHRLQSLCALWPLASAAPLRAGVEAGAYRSVWRALRAFHVVPCLIEEAPDPFFNVNTAADLVSAAERMAGETTPSTTPGRR